MFPGYSSISDGDVEKQGLQPSKPSCQCWQQQWQEQIRQRKQSRLMIFLLILVAFSFVGYHHYHHHRVDAFDHHPVDGMATFTKEDPVKICAQPTVPWDGQTTFEFDEKIKHLAMSQKTFKSTLEGLHHGKIDVQVNEALEKTKVTFDIKLSDEAFNDYIWIDEHNSEDTVRLVVRSEHDVPLCFQINAVIQVPNKASLDALAVEFASNDVQIIDALQLQDLALSVVSGNVHIVQPLQARHIDMAAASGQLIGVFDVDQVDFKSATASGNTDLTFIGIHPISSIDASSASGSIQVQVPSTFESKMELSCVVGNVHVNAVDSSKLHYRRSGGIVGHTLKGYYGTDSHPPSNIKISTVSGNANLDIV
ncbi:uncharacterized protein BX664DRAFT_339652 [Halteromyces radiatus]|uniref:uncharacterized protein n=1 Tax=Halteromyces radiatus TaxID=101107 RepID=UPI00221F46C2|nr:uncharacterized protein BX664DRAFT_339652 [Halteromyces radiatus]KAI8083029.1 hypothetical protein BX664DRAFT_339652 [Halteromyces radiatus]